jgi:hypothetical protein
MTKDKAQRRRWTFCEAAKNRKAPLTIHGLFPMMRLHAAASGRSDDYGGVLWLNVRFAVLE